MKRLQLLLASCCVASACDVPTAPPPMRVVLAEPRFPVIVVSKAMERRFADILAGMAPEPRFTGIIGCNGPVFLSGARWLDSLESSNPCRDSAVPIMDRPTEWHDAQVCTLVRAALVRYRQVDTADSTPAAAAAVYEIEGDGPRIGRQFTVRPGTQWIVELGRGPNHPAVRVVFDAATGSSELRTAGRDPFPIALGDPRPGRATAWCDRMEMSGV